MVTTVPKERRNLECIVNCQWQEKGKCIVYIDVGSGCHVNKAGTDCLTYKERKEEDL